jgi:hypothetical protein
MEVLKLPLLERVRAQLDAVVQRWDPSPTYGLASESYGFSGRGLLKINGHKLDKEDYVVGDVAYKNAYIVIITGMLVGNWLFCLEHSRVTNHYKIGAFWGDAHYSLMTINRQHLTQSTNPLSVLLAYLVTNILPITHPGLVLKEPIDATIENFTQSILFIQV